MYEPDKFDETLDKKVAFGIDQSEYLFKGRTLDTSRLEPHHPNKELYHRAEFASVAGFDKPLQEAWLEHELQSSSDRREAIRTERAERSGIAVLANLRRAPEVPDPTEDDFRSLSYDDLKLFLYEQGGDPMRSRYLVGLLTPESAKRRGVNIFEVEIQTVTIDLKSEYHAPEVKKYEAPAPVEVRKRVDESAQASFGRAAVPVDQDTTNYLGHGPRPGEVDPNAKTAYGELPSIPQTPIPVPPKAQPSGRVIRQVEPRTGRRDDLGEALAAEMGKRSVEDPDIEDQLGTMPMGKEYPELAGLYGNLFADKKGDDSDNN